MIRSKIVCLLLFASVFCLSNLNLFNTLPLKSKERDNIKAYTSIEVPSPEILRFMRRFGYLEPNPSDSEALYHESAIVEAVKNIQKFGAINPTGILDDVTLKLLSKPRCGVPDFKITYNHFVNEATTNAAIHGRRRRRRYILGARAWTKRQLKYLIANWSLKMSTFQIERAFALWSRYSGLQFKRVSDTDADIIVGFGSLYHGDNFPFDGPGNILAHAYYPYELGSWGGDIHFDEDENWKENSTNLANGVDFFSVAVHEVGHSLGLAHSPIYSSIMFPYYKGPEHNVFDYDDILAMYEMYLSKHEDQSTTPTQNDEKELFTETATESKYFTPPTPSYTVEDDTNYCDGDCVTLEKHETNEFSRNTSDDRNNQQPELPEIPNICLGHFDAVTLINGSVHIFKKQYVWKLTEQYTIVDGYPRSLWDLFPFLPVDVQRIDAAYERYDGATVLFTKVDFWVFRGSEVLENSPNKLSNLIGTKSRVSEVDAVMMWPKNNYTYIFAGSIFWRYNDQLKLLDAGYPKSMNRWPGVPHNLNAATTLNNGKNILSWVQIYGITLFF